MWLMRTLSCSFPWKIWYFLKSVLIHSPPFKALNIISPKYHAICKARLKVLNIFKFLNCQFLNEFCQIFIVFPNQNPCCVFKYFYSSEQSQRSAILRGKQQNTLPWCALCACVGPNPNFFLAHNSSFLLWAKFFDITHAKLPFFIICQILQHRAHNPLKMFSVVGPASSTAERSAFVGGQSFSVFTP